MTHVELRLLVVPVGVLVVPQEGQERGPSLLRAEVLKKSKMLLTAQGRHKRGTREALWCEAQGLNVRNLVQHTVIIRR